MDETVERTDWARIQARLRRSTLLFAWMAGMNVIPAIVTNWEFGIAAATFAAFACITEGLRIVATRRIRGPVGIVALVIGSVVGVVAGFIALGQLLGGGLFLLISPLALLDDSLNEDGHIQKKFFSLVLLAGIWLVSAILGVVASWQLFRAVGKLPLSKVSSGEAPAPG